MLLNVLFKTNLISVIKKIKCHMWRENVTCERELPKSVTYCLNGPEKRTLKKLIGLLKASLKLLDFEVRTLLHH